MTIITNPFWKVTTFLKKFIRIAICRCHLHHVLRAKNKNKIVILLYHNFYTSQKHTNVSINVKSFESHLKYLQKYYNVISLTSLVEYLNGKKDIPENSVVLTFDDGYMNNYTLAYPLLEKYNMHATIFLVAQTISSHSWLWVNILEYVISETDQENLEIDLPDGENKVFFFRNTNEKHEMYNKIKELMKIYTPKEIRFLMDQIIDKLQVKIEYNMDSNYQMLDLKTIKKMSPEFIDFGSHTLSHSILTKLNRDEVVKEVAESKVVLEKMLEYQVQFFCYPNGNYNDEVVDITSKYYDAALITEGGFVDKDSNPFTLKRVAAKSDFYHFVWSLVHPTT